MAARAQQGGVIGAGGLRDRLRWARLVPWTLPRALLASAFETEVEERRIFLWVPVLSGAGVVLYFNAAQEPSLWAMLVLSLVLGAAAHAARKKRAVFFAFAGLCAVALGFLSGQLRTWRVMTPMVERIRIVELTGYIEEMDIRREGARFLLRVASAEGLGPRETPYRVRLTMRQAPNVEAGDFVALKARLLPPARAVLPGGYDFSRDAFFARIGAVGSTLGRIEALTAPDPPDLLLAMMMAVDRARNALAQRVDHVIGGDAGAIAAAMVTGKRDRLSEGTRELIREAGIFHIITISGVQMTLVAGIFFWIFRRSLALSTTLALHYPIKKWAAAAAMLGAIFYDITTGSRVGTERALFMTLIVFAAVIADRQALTMRNLALAALCVIVLEPEAILGVSFQLSFAAVAALVAVYEARMRARAAGPPGLGVGLASTQGWRVFRAWLAEQTRHGIGATLFATFCATAATASFMAFHFHELSPYVLIGNPLTLAIIEFFAVPGALLGAALYPLGLDAPVWHYVGLGIEFVLWAARHIAAAPGSTLHLGSFAPWAIIFLALAVLSMVIWRTGVFRATALPLLLLGLLGANMGIKMDVAIAPTGEGVAARTADGHFLLLGKKLNPFAGEQWLRADGDGRSPVAAHGKTACDASGCVAILADGRALALVLQAGAFAEDCERAAIIVTPLFAPRGCRAKLVFDRRSLAHTGAVGLDLSGPATIVQTARATDEDRPWSRRPKWGRVVARGPVKPFVPGAADADDPPDSIVSFN